MLQQRTTLNVAKIAPSCRLLTQTSRIGNPGDYSEYTKQRGRLFRSMLRRAALFAKPVSNLANQILHVVGNGFDASIRRRCMANSEAIEKLKAVMEETGKSVEDIFNEMDTDGDGLVNGPELFKGEETDWTNAFSRPNFNDDYGYRYQRR